MPQQAVRIWQAPLTIPTHPVGPAEALPIFYAGRGYQGAKGPVYPYPLLDDLSDRKQDRTCQAVYLENEFVHLCVLPEIGGRIFRGLDKTNNYDFIYRQQVVKPALIGMLGAWISGGVEWNIPHHHRPSTFMPLAWRAVGGEDGSQTLWVGETEFRHRMRWIVGLTLRPGRSDIEVATRIFNRTPYAHSFLSFTNLAVHVNESYQVIFPPSTQWGTQHAKCEFVRWPVADSVYNGVDFTAGVDVSWWKNHPSSLSIFGWNYEEDFFGGYDHGRDAGIVHVADHHAVPGKKFFTFGNGPAGRMWDSMLTDQDGPYLELMAGAYSDNQPDYSWIQPYETKTITECWYPLRGLGGFKSATREGALNVQVQDGQRLKAKVTAYATGTHKDATLLVKLGEQVLASRKITIAPDQPARLELELPAQHGQQALRAALLDSAGRELVAYQPAAQTPRPMPAVVTPPKPPAEIPTAEECFLTGQRIEQFHSPSLQAEPYCQEVLRRDAGDVRANTALGIGYLKRGMNEEARRHLERAVQRLSHNYTSPQDGQAIYYLGLAERALGEPAAASAALGKAEWSYAFRCAANYQLAELGCQAGDYEAALRRLDASLACNTLNVRALCAKSYALRKLGRHKEALAAAEAASRLDPLDVFAAYERLEAMQADSPAVQSATAQLDALLGQDCQPYLELASDYQNLGAYDYAAAVLRKALQDASSATPLVLYGLAHCWGLRGQEAQADEHRQQAHQARPDYCFPFRPEEAAWLRAAMQQDPDDARAPYYLGNLLYDLQPQEAIQAWERSRELDESFWIVHRNLGLAYWRVRADLRAAAASLRRAVELNGRSGRLLAELDGVLELAGAKPRERLALLEAHEDAVAASGQTLLRQIALHVQVGQYDRALELLASRHFHIWEGGEQNVHDVYVDAHLLKGRTLLDAGDARAALAEFTAATEYPRRFEVGEPYDGGRAPQVQWFIAQANEALGQADAARTAYERSAAGRRKGTFLTYYRGLALQKLAREQAAQECFAELAKQGQELLAAKAGGFFDKFGHAQAEHVVKSQGHLLLGLGLLGQGRADQAAAELRQAVECNPNNLWANVLEQGRRS